MTKNSSRTYSLQPQGIAQRVATWFIELLHCRIDGPEHELKHQLPEKSRHMTFHPPICQFLQAEMWTFSAFCCVCPSFLSGWVEPPQKNHLGADSMALCRHRVSKRKQLKPPQILPCSLFNLIISDAVPHLLCARDQWKKGSTDNLQVVLRIKLFLAANQIAHSNWVIWEFNKEVINESPGTESSVGI